MSTSDIYSTFREKNVFATGVTGFVGKVVLYKLLKEFPDIGTIYILVRPRKNVTPQQRVEKEVLTSEAFRPLRDAIGEPEWQRRRAKIRAVGGDIMEDRLGINPAEYAELCSKLHFILHMAATVDFDEKLNVSVRMNVLGSLRVMALAQRCPHLEAFVHTSTCYVNWSRHSSTVPVKEVLYPLAFDPENMVKYILSLDDTVVAQTQSSILAKYNFPNTYTMTKCMTEHLLMRRRGALPMVIVRPAIVGAAWREPSVGWVDALTAAGAVLLTAGLGVLTDMACQGYRPTDVVPVDHVVNILIKAAYKCSANYKATRAVTDPSAMLGQKNATADAAPKGIAMAMGKGSSAPTAAGSQGLSGALVVATSALAQSGHENAGPAESEASEGVVGASFPRVYQASTTWSLNTLDWNTARSATKDFWGAQRHPKAIGPPTIVLHPTRLSYDIAWFMHSVLPFQTMRILANMPVIGSEKKRKLVVQYKRAIDRSKQLNRAFEPFMNFEWRFDSTNVTTVLDEGLPDATRLAFGSDPYDINWYKYICAYHAGMMKHILKTPGDAAKMPAIGPSGAEQLLKASL